MFQGKNRETVRSRQSRVQVPKPTRKVTSVKWSLKHDQIDPVAQEKWGAVCWVLYKAATTRTTCRSSDQTSRKIPTTTKHFNQNAFELKLTENPRKYKHSHLLRIASSASSNSKIQKHKDSCERKTTSANRDKHQFHKYRAKICDHLWNATVANFESGLARNPCSAKRSSSSASSSAACSTASPCWTTPACRASRSSTSSWSSAKSRNTRRAARKISESGATIDEIKLSSLRSCS